MITDGGTLNDEHFYVILFQTPDRLLYYDVVNLESTDHKSIAGVLANAVIEINKFCGTEKIFSTCTDNAANLLAATKVEHNFPDTVQKLSNTTIIHVSCGIHSTQLLLTDFKKKSTRFKSYIDQIKSIVVFLKSKENKSILHCGGTTSKIPKILDIKWCSYYDAALWIWDNKKQINTVLSFNINKKKKVPIKSIPSYYGKIAEAFKPLKDFVRAIEGDTILRSQLYYQGKLLSKAWKSQKGNDFALEMLKLFKERFKNMADEYLFMLSYIFSKDGFKWFKAKMNYLNSIKYPLSEENQRKIEKWAQKLDNLKRKMKSIMGYYNLPIIDFEEQWNHFFTRIPNVIPNHMFWSRTRTRIYKKVVVEGKTINKVMDSFAYAAEMISILPATEAAAERFFSELGMRFPSSRWASKHELIRAEMRCKMNLKLGLSEEVITGSILG